MEKGDITIIILTLLATLIMWLLRKTPLGFLWQIWKWFWIVLFATLLANYAKKEIKEWWNK